jgi:hypothetical protein
VKVILWIVVVYAAICVVAYFGNCHYMYFPDPARIAPAEAGLNSIEGPDGLRLPRRFTDHDQLPAAASSSQPLAT